METNDFRESGTIPTWADLVRLSAILSTSWLLIRQQSA
jgi:hypothetical protein